MSRGVSWVKFFPNDWLGSSRARGMTLEARGLYIDLLALQASSPDGGIPADPTKIRRLVAGLLDAEFDRAWPEVKDAFPEGHDGRRRNPKLAELWSQANARCEANRSNGSVGGQTKSQNKSKSKSKSKDATANARASGVANARANGVANAQANARANATPNASPDGAPRRAPSAPNWEEALRERGQDPEDYRAACEEWESYRREAKLKTWSKTTWKKSLTQVGTDPTVFAASVERSIANGYSGLFPPKPSKISGYPVAPRPPDVVRYDDAVPTPEERRRLYGNG